MALAANGSAKWKIIKLPQIKCDHLHVFWQVIKMKKKKEGTNDRNFPLFVKKRCLQRCSINAMIQFERTHSRAREAAPFGHNLELSPGVGTSAQQGRKHGTLAGGLV